MTITPDVRSGLTLSGAVGLTPWRAADVDDAFAVYGAAAVTSWPCPQVDRVADLAAMRALVEQWGREGLGAPHGRWAVRRLDDGGVVGGATLLPLPPGDEDTGMTWQLRPDADAQLAEETAFLVASQGFAHGLDEVFALVRPGADTTAIRRNGMYWVGETSKYFGLDLQVYRLRVADLDRVAPEGHHPPS
ncbi:GNAT family N-acetyltransferase [Actinokineospora terrae]|uniref:N-acetyltransferase domain-containing protein n=1 Tax=Actinokineospora terrae TaxID=155974 RepID=A0A1H9MWS7_9PSEU|nr:GNAT family N-acetyltransferase [Actinokineospora terrae]SER28118.1 hypothetical protein SAMN04487818_102382 [Actinokineospora terrae]